MPERYDDSEISRGMMIAMILIFCAVLLALVWAPSHVSAGEFSPTNAQLKHDKCVNALKGFYKAQHIIDMWEYMPIELPDGVAEKKGRATEAIWQHCPGLPGPEQPPYPDCIDPDGCQKGF